MMDWLKLLTMPIMTDTWKKCHSKRDFLIMDLLKPKTDNLNQTVNILLGPKLGDLFQMLVVPQYLWKFYGIKSNIYITEVFDTFTTGLQDTFESLEPIIKAQKFTNSFEEMCVSIIAAPRAGVQCRKCQSDAGARHLIFDLSIL